jgi:hypothetical protein
MPEYGMEAFAIASQKEVQNTTISRESDADTFLELIRTDSRTLSRKGQNSKQYPLQ